MGNAIRIEGTKYGIKFLPEQMICEDGEYNGKKCAVVWWEGVAKIYRHREDKHTIKIETSPAPLDDSVPEYALTPEGGIVYFARITSDGKTQIVDRPKDVDYDSKIDEALEKIYKKAIEVDILTNHQDMPVITPDPIFIELEKELTATSPDKIL